MISRPTILRSVIGRFLPGVLAFFGGGLYLTARVKGLTLGPAQIEAFTSLMLVMTLGFVTCVSLLRRVLPRAAGVDGRRSVIAGFTAPMILSKRNKCPSHRRCFIPCAIINILSFQNYLPVPW